MASLVRTVRVPTRHNAPLPYFPAKDPADVLEYTLDATDWLFDHGHLMDDCSVSPGVGLMTSARLLQGDGGVLSRVVVMVGGGVSGTVPLLGYTMSLAGGGTLALAVRVPVQGRVPCGYFLPSLQQPGGSEPVGGEGAITSQLITGAAVGGHRALMFAANGTVVHANPMSVLYVFAGVSTQAATSGTAILVVQDGQISEPSWAWVPGGEVYAGLDGTLTQTTPTAGILHQIGTAGSATTLIVQPYPPIILI